MFVDQSMLIGRRWSRFFGEQLRTGVEEYSGSEGSRRYGVEAVAYQRTLFNMTSSAVFSNR